MNKSEVTQPMLVGSRDNDNMANIVCQEYIHTTCIHIEIMFLAVTMNYLFNGEATPFSPDCIVNTKRIYMKILSKERQSNHVSYIKC